MRYRIDSLLKIFEFWAKIVNKKHLFCLIEANSQLDIKLHLFKQINLFMFEKELISMLMVSFLIGIS